MWSLTTRKGKYAICGSILADGGSKWFTMIWRMCLAYFHKIALNYQQVVRLTLEQEMQQMNEFMLEISGTDESKGRLRNIPSVE